MIAHTLLGLPWAILPTAVSQLASAAPRAAAADKVGHPALSQVITLGHTAILPIIGTIGKGMSTDEEYFYDQCNLHRIDQQIENIAADPLIKNVVLYISSPGGVTIGVETTARKIRELSAAGKVTVAYTDTYAASAAYWLASACQRIVANPTAILGSISTLTVAYDYSKYLENEGIQVKVFRTGELKGAGTFGKPWTPEEEAAVERRMAHIDAVFKGFIQANRPALDPAQMNGDYWYASGAPLGALDATADTIDDLLASLQ